MEKTQVYLRKEELDALRKAAARTKEALWRAIGHILATAPPSECANYLDHCGYGST